MNVKDYVPRPIREKVKQSTLWRDRFKQKRGMNLAANSKRLDLCVGQMAHMLHLVGRPSLEDKICMEVGSGWVLTHALVCHLLGAKKVIATDIEPLAQPQYLTTAVNDAVQYIVRDLLSPFADHAEVRARLLNLSRIQNYTFDTLRELGIHYEAPIDLTRNPMHEKVDFIYSLSALEHVPVEDVPLLLENLYDMLSPGGAMLHAIHLEDHDDILNDPFLFLGTDGDTFDRAEQTERGNRLRRSSWKNRFDALSGFDWRFIFEFNRRDKPLPDQIDAAVENEGPEDLSASHLGVYGVKPAN